MRNSIQIIDFSDCPLNIRHGGYGGQAGLKDGILYNGENWIVKYPKNTKGMSRVDGLSYTTSPLSEYIGSHIYQILDFDVHETLLGIRNRKLVVACKDFRADDEMLFEVRTLKNAANLELAERLERDFSETGSAHEINLEELVLHLKENDVLKGIQGIEERFWDCVIVDILINNNDRNNGNWGILRKSGCPDRIAPVFDNGASFSPKVPDEKLIRYLMTPESLKSSALNTVTAYAIDGKQLLAKNMLQLDIPELKQAILRVVPLVEQKKHKIIDFVQNIPEYCQTPERVYPVCSKTRANYYIASVNCRMEYFLLPAFKKISHAQKGLF